MEKKIKNFSSSLYMRRKARKTTAMTHSTISHVTNVKKAMIFFLLSFSHFSSGYSACKKKRRGSGLRYFGNKLWRPTPRSGQSGQSRPKTGPHGSQRVVFLELKKAQRWPRPLPRPFRKLHYFFGTYSREISRSRSA